MGYLKYKGIPPHKRYKRAAMLTDFPEIIIDIGMQKVTTNVQTLVQGWNNAGSISIVGL